MITFAQLQADPSNMELANAYAVQQGNITNAQGGTGPSQGSPNLTQGQQYLAGNADVFNNAVSRANDEGLFGGDAFSTRLDEIAREHFNAFGVADGRAGFGYTPPATGTFAPSPNETPSFSAPPGGNAGNPSTDNTLQSGLPGYAQPIFDTSQYDTAFQNTLGNFNGLLDDYNSFFGDMLTNATNAQNQQPQYGGGFLPFATTLMPGGGGYQTTYNPFNTFNSGAPSHSAGTFGSNSSFGSGSGIGSMAGQAANSAHRQWFTL